MLTTKQAFEKFRQRLELSDTEAEDAQRRHKEVRGHIEADFDVASATLSGSYARHTKTKPLKDVDIFFVLGEDERWRRDKKPIEMLNAFHDCLLKHYPKDQLETNRRCVTVFFDKRSYSDDSDGKVLSIDAVPAFACGSDFEIPDKVQDDWIKTNPGKHKAETTQKNNDLDCKWVPLTKMLKSWNRANGHPIKPSFLVEVMALNLVDGPFSDFANEARNFFASAAANVHLDWPDPAGLGPPVSDQMTAEMRASAKKRLLEAQQKATLAFRAEAASRQGEAVNLWQEIFGPFFAKS